MSEGCKRLNYYLTPGKYERYEDAKKAAEKAWEDFLPHIPWEIIYENKRENDLKGYLHQVVCKHGDGYAEIITITITPHQMIML